MELTLTSSLENVTFNTTGNFKLQAPVVGLDTPTERTSFGNYSGTDGGYVASQFYGVRDFSITGFIRSESTTQHALDRQILTNSVPLKEDIGITIITFAGQSLYFTARRTRLSMDVIKPCVSAFKIDFVAPDHLIYDISEGSMLSVTLSKLTGGGAILPFILPVTLDASAGSQSVINSGTSTIYPLITVSGTVTNPRITNLTTNQAIEITINMSGADELLIDMRHRTITLNGSNILAYKTTDSEWWGLFVGSNLLQFETDGGGDTGTATVTWRPAVTGI